MTRESTEREETEEALRELSGRLIEAQGSEAQGSERRRITLSLSDSTGPSLTTLISKLHLAKSRPELIHDCVALAEFVSREIRTVSDHRYPPSLETDRLPVTLRVHLKGLTQQRGIPIDVDYPAHLEHLRPAAAALLRVIREFFRTHFPRRGKFTPSEECRLPWRSESRNSAGKMTGESSRP